jgi:hypothetical protein
LAILKATVKEFVSGTKEFCRTDYRRGDALHLHSRDSISNPAVLTGKELEAVISLINIPSWHLLKGHEEKKKKKKTHSLSMAIITAAI